MNSQLIKMNHTTETIIALNTVLLLNHFMTNVYIVFKVLLLVLSLLYVLYNLRVQINNAGGFKKYIKEFKNWKY